MSFQSPEGGVELRPVAGLAELRPALESLITESLAPRPGQRILIKPNLNNDLPALTGNSADLRLLCALIELLLDRGLGPICIADGSNVGVHRRGIDALKRLRVDRLAERYGVEVRDLNDDEVSELPLSDGSLVRVARCVLEADFLLSVPKIKTHAEAGFSCAMKNLVGVCSGQDKRKVHRDLPGNIVALNRAIRPDLVLVDGLVAMEGNGPGDGNPVRLDLLLAGTDALLVDLVASRLVGLDWTRLPVFQRAVEELLLDPALAAEVKRQVPVRRPILPAPRRTRLAELADHPRLAWLKRAARPLIDGDPRVIEGAYALGVVQDLYDREDDQVTGLVRAPETCGDCRRCEEFCPTRLPLERIGRGEEPDCIGCLYCWWACPKEAITLQGSAGQLTRQAERYKAAIEVL